MFEIRTIKTRAHWYFSRYYGACVSASVILALFLIIWPPVREFMHATSMQIKLFDVDGFSMYIGDNSELHPHVNYFTFIMAVSFHPLLRIGFRYSCLLTYRGYRIQSRIMVIAGFFKYFRKLGCILLRDLLVLLWTLLLVVPGILKALSYFMVPYILADCPNVKAWHALKLSVRMTQGHRGQIALMYVSFTGWILLSMFTFGIVEVFFRAPYMGVSLAGLYEELKCHALRTGVVHPAELV